MKVVSSAQLLRQELAQVSRSLMDRKAQQGSSSRGVFSLPLPPQAGGWSVKPYSLLQVQGFYRIEALPQHVVSDPLFETFSVLEFSQVAFQRGVKLFRYRTDSVSRFLSRMGLWWCFHLGRYRFLLVRARRRLLLGMWVLRCRGMRVCHVVSLLVWFLRI